MLLKIRRVEKFWHLLFNKPSDILLWFMSRSWFPITSERYIKCWYYFKTGDKLNLENPRTFNEKLQWLKLYNHNPDYTKMVDKLSVKEYISQKIGSKYVIPLLGVWETPEDIDFDTLPNQFVLKTTHGGGGGGVVICKDKTLFDINNAKCILSDSMRSDGSVLNKEWPYKNVPKRIIAEEYMVDESGCELKDYKFFCFNGRVQCYKVDYDRFISHKANYYDRESQLLPFGEVVCPADFSKVIEIPNNIDSMIELAEILSKDIPFVRIDFYNIMGRIYFGEITFFPAAGIGKFEPQEWDFILGDWIKLPMHIKI